MKSFTRGDYNLAMVKIICEKCGREISKSNYSKHLRGHENHPEYYDNSKYHLDHSDLSCKFCGKECKNKNSLVQHEIRCKDNPDRKPYDLSKFNTKGHPAWNKGLTKHTSDSLRRASETLSKNTKGKPGRSHSDETKNKLRQIAIKNGLGGFNMRNKGIIYNDVKLDSSFELAVAKELDANGIVWQRCYRFPYIDLNGLEHTYTPDFYLPDFDVYIDPKNDYLINNINPSLGYSDLDKVKWVMEQNGIKVIILDSHQLTWASIKDLINAMLV